MNLLEAENQNLKNRVEKLEKALNTKTINNKTIIDGLKLVTDASKIGLYQLREKEKIINKQSNEINKIRSDVASLKGITPGGTLGVEEGATGPGTGDSWARVVSKGRKKGGKKIGKQQFKEGRDFEVFTDSHGRELVNLLKGAEVTVKPGAKMERVVEGAGRGGKMCTVLMGGTNDNSVEQVRRGLSKIREGMGKNRRVVIVGVPHRYDEPYPFVDQLIERKNQLLYDFCKLNNYVFLSVDDIERNCFTKHGLHLNMAGKRRLAAKIQTAVSFL